jgi:CO/xanthine dehydrogenase Mo-binding subunit
VDIVTWEDEDIKNLRAGGGFMGPALPFLDNIAEQEGAVVAVIVVAEDEEICDEALRELDIKWEVLPHVVDILEGRKPDAPLIRPASPAGKSGFLKALEWGKIIIPRKKVMSPIPMSAKGIWRLVSEKPTISLNMI